MRRLRSLIDIIRATVIRSKMEIAGKIRAEYMELLRALLGGSELL